MEAKAFIGIDIGKNGGICMMEPTEGVKTRTIPLDKEGELDINEISDFLLRYKISYKDSLTVGFEKLTSLHLASKKANWSLALQAGAIEAICITLGINYKAIPPKEWQHKIFEKLPPVRQESGSKDTKTMAFLAITALYPDLDITGGKKRSSKPHDGIVDAVLICEYIKQIK